MLCNSNSVHKNALQSITITLKTYSQNAIFTYENCNYTSFTIKMQIKKIAKSSHLIAERHFIVQEVFTIEI